jgi:hypothetical protein
MELFMYTWKYHKETPCVAVSNKQKYHFPFFFFLQNQGIGGQNRSCLGMGTSGSKEEMGKVFKRVNVMQILYTRVFKWKHDTS